MLGVNGIPATGVGAIVLDIAATSASATGNTNLKVWSSGTTMPLTPQLTVNSTSTPRSNTVVVQPGSDGKIAVYNSTGTTAINVDVQGYFTVASSNSALTPGGFMPVDMTRVLFTDDGTGESVAHPLAAGASLTVQVGGVGPIPADASSVFANIRVHNITTQGALQVVPAGTDPASARALMNYADGAQNNSGATLKLSSDGKLTVRNTGNNPVDVDLGVEGYFASSSSTGGGFTPIVPIRLAIVTLAPGDTQDIAAGGVGGIPTYGSGGVMLSLAGSDATGAGYGGLWAYRAGAADTGQMILGWRAGSPTTTATTSAIVKPGSNGKITLSNASSSPGSISVSVMAEGWFASPAVIPTDQQADFIDEGIAEGFTQDFINQAIYDQSMATQIDKPALPGPVPPAPTASPDPSATATPTPSTGPATVSGYFTTLKGVPVPNLTVTLTVANTTPATGAEVAPPVVGSTTTDSAGLWTFTLPDPLPSDVQPHADRNGGVLNLLATVSGAGPDGMQFAGQQAVAAGVATGSMTTELSAAVRADSTAQTGLVLAAPLDAPVDTKADPGVTANQASDAEQFEANFDGGTQADSAPVWQSDNETGLSSTYNPDLVNGVDYSAVLPMDNPCFVYEKHVSFRHAKVTVAEAHAFWDATTYIQYSNGLSTEIGFNLSLDARGWKMSGGVTLGSDTGGDIISASQGPFWAKTFRVPMKFEKVRVHQHCLHPVTDRYWYDVNPIGYEQLPSDNHTYFWGANVEDYDGAQGYYDAPAKNQSTIPRNSGIGVHNGTSVAYGVAGSVYGLEISAQTKYNSSHEEYIIAGALKRTPHNAWGEKGPWNDNAGVEYSY